MEASFPGTSSVRFVFRHLAGSRATEVEIVPLGAHRELILGRAPSAAVRFDPRREPLVGRHHARITPTMTDGTAFELADLDSRNGTYVNGLRIERPVVLRAGDIIQLGAGGPTLEFRIEGAIGVTDERPQPPVRDEPEVAAATALYATPPPGPLPQATPSPPHDLHRRRPPDPDPPPSPPA
jgi:serine protease Do